MRSSATAAPAPVPRPERRSSRPEVVRLAPKPPRHTSWAWMVGVIVIVAAGFAYRHSLASRAPAKPGVALRTAKVRRGPLERTLRLSGVTIAQKSVTLLTPQM